MTGRAITRRSYSKTAAPGSRTFYDFEPRKLNLVLSEFGQRVKVAPSALFRYNDVLLTPLSRVSRGLFLGGASDGNGFIDQLALYRGWSSTLQRHIDPASVAPLGAPVEQQELPEAFFAGYLFNHFGHFLLESLARLIPAALNSSIPIVYFNPMGLKQLPLYMRDILERLRIDLSRIILCDVPTRVETLIASNPSYQIRGYVNASALSAYKIQADVQRTTRPLYLSRTGLVNRRTIFGELELENSLRELFDVEVVHPERMTVEEQLTKLAGADTIIACAGSALHSLIFVEGLRRVVIIAPSLLPTVNYMLCDELFESETIYIAGAKSIDESGDWEIDPEVVLGALSRELNK